MLNSRLGKYESNGGFFINDVLVSANLMKTSVGFVSIFYTTEPAKRKKGEWTSECISELTHHTMEVVFAQCSVVYFCIPKGCEKWLLRGEPALRKKSKRDSDKDRLGDSYMHLTFHTATA